MTTTKDFELYVISGSRCVGLYAYHVDGQLGHWPLDLPADAVPMTPPKTIRAAIRWRGFVVALALGAAMMAATAAARADPLDPPRPHYTPSWERTQRGYLPSFQFEQERRAICGDLCDDLNPPRRRHERALITK